MKRFGGDFCLKVTTELDKKEEIEGLKKII